MKKKADMGIGTLIIFIAMILVAAIAAGVLIQTATSLQNRALLTGDRSQSQVSTSIRPVVIYAEDGTSNSVEDFFMTLKLAPGSDAIKFDDLLIEFSLTDDSKDLVFNDTVDECNSTITSIDEFKVEYLIDGGNQVDGYLQRGDVVKLCFKSPRAVEEDESVTITMVPKVGSPTVTNTALPDIMAEQRINIFP